MSTSPATLESPNAVPVTSSVPNPVANASLIPSSVSRPPPAVQPKPATHQPTMAVAPNASSVPAGRVSAVLRAPAAAPTAAVSAPPAPSTKTKSKKKKTPTVTMATASSASGSGQGSQGENTGRWTAEEHQLFLQGLEKYGKGWKKIACLIKSRTVVQIRTHAQKYFQKLAKARQNGEEGDVAMDARGGASAPTVSTSTAQSNKRRRQTSGTKRKAIQSVVSSAQRQGKRAVAQQTAAGVKNPKAPVPAVAPALSPYVLSNTTQPSQPNTVNASCVPSITTAQGTISGPALEDSLFRFMTPSQPVPAEPQVNDVARQAGANPITLPSDQPSASATALAGEVSPTGVAELAMYPSWTDAKDTPSWYAKGADVDELLDVAGTLEWLTDSGDIHETYQLTTPAPAPTSAAAQAPTAHVPAPAPTAQHHNHMSHTAPAPVSVADMPAPTPVGSSQSNITSSASASNLRLDSVNATGDDVVPPLPSLFEEGVTTEHGFMEPDKVGLQMSSSATSIDDHLQVFDTPLEEQDFVSTLLDTNGESSTSLPAMG